MIHIRHAGATLCGAAGTDADVLREDVSRWLEEGWPLHPICSRCLVPLLNDFWAAPCACGHARRDHAGRGGYCREGAAHAGETGDCRCISFRPRGAGHG